MLQGASRCTTFYPLRGNEDLVSVTVAYIVVCRSACQQGCGMPMKSWLRVNTSDA